VQTGGILNVKDANRHIKARKDGEIRRLFVAGQCKAKKRQEVVASNPSLIDPELEENEGGDRVNPQDSENTLFFIDTQGWQM
jgi:hypothetical protein